MQNIGFMADAIKAKIMAAIFNAGNATPPPMPTPPTSFEVAFLAVPPSRTDATPVGELQATSSSSSYYAPGYARTSIPSTSVAWTASGSNNLQTLAAQLLLAVPTATWPTIYGIALVDASNDVWFAIQVNPTNYTTASAPKIAAGALVVSL